MSARVGAGWPETLHASGTTSEIANKVIVTAPKRKQDFRRSSGDFLTTDTITDAGKPTKNPMSHAKYRSVPPIRNIDISSSIIQGLADGQ